MEITNKDPFVLFNNWYLIREKSGLDNYNAVALSSSANDCRVSSRMVLLKKYDNSGFVFFTNYQSRKGLQLSANPFASMLFYWPEQGRQVRIEGTVEKINEKESDNYFHSRQHGHMLNALVSPQSREISGRHYLVEKYEKLLDRYKGSGPPRPDYWGGYRLKPELFEFWQEGTNRFHDRLEYRLQRGKWIIRRLAP